MESETKRIDSAAKQYGYKMVNFDLRGRNKFQFVIGETAKEYGKLEICHLGLHFCRRAIDCLKYCNGFIMPPYRYLRVFPMSSVVTIDDKFATLDLQIESEMTPREWHLQMQKEHRASAETDPIYHIKRGILNGDRVVIEKAIMNGAWDRRSSYFPMVAAELGQTTAMTILFESGFGDMNDAVSTAIARDQIKVFELLLQLLRKRGSAWKNDALLFSAKMGRSEIVAMLVAAGATELHTALALAVINDKIDVVRVLLAKNAVGAHSVQAIANMHVKSPSMGKLLMAFIADAEQSPDGLSDAEQSPSGLSDAEKNAGVETVADMILSGIERGVKVGNA